VSFVSQLVYRYDQNVAYAHEVEKSFMNLDSFHTRVIIYFGKNLVGLPDAK
jgi:hypothetical protein